MLKLSQWMLHKGFRGRTSFLRNKQESSAKVKFYSLAPGFPFKANSLQNVVLMRSIVRYLEPGYFEIYFLTVNIYKFYRVLQTPVYL